MARRCSLEVLFCFARQSVMRLARLPRNYTNTEKCVSENICEHLLEVMPRDGIEPPTRGFSVRCDMSKKVYPCLDSEERHRNSGTARLWMCTTVQVRCCQNCCQRRSVQGRITVGVSGMRCCHKTLHSRAGPQSRSNASARACASIMRLALST